MSDFDLFDHTTPSSLLSVLDHHHHHLVLIVPPSSSPPSHPPMLLQIQGMTAPGFSKVMAMNNVLQHSLPVLGLRNCIQCDSLHEVSNRLVSPPMFCHRLSSQVSPDAQADDNADYLSKQCDIYWKMHCVITSIHAHQGYAPVPMTMFRGRTRLTTLH
ncbi:hypothetical protein K443DRAFT_6135 [Laccaria amethystina LaAM-08-1]|uniref:Uncharacterized protein n=1 Tax=Laccaria amethystina LaAM-08-1 TaxID=1095629 RepID=A0A0C9WTV0_9AGAR|nr:hypothetical protein K443DRAFT_6135 [Laccaria amethystina LaAM-08-1]